MRSERADDSRHESPPAGLTGESCGQDDSHRCESDFSAVLNDDDFSHTLLTQLRMLHSDEAGDAIDQELLKRVFSLMCELHVRSLDKREPAKSPLGAEPIATEAAGRWADQLMQQPSVGRLESALNSLMSARELGEDLLRTRLGRPLVTSESHAWHGGFGAFATGVSTSFAASNELRVQSESKALAKYLSFLSHDLRGNLNGALLMVEVLRRDLATHEQFADSLEDLDQMRQSMMGLVGTMDRFLVAERLRQGRVEISTERLDLSQFLRDQRDQMSRQRRGSGELIEIAVPVQSIVTSDREMLTLIIQNLLGNCVKYSDGGMVGIRAFLTGGAEAPLYRIEISDTGPGMTKEVKDELFTAFAQSADRSRGGTGLGLFIAKQAAELIGAKITVESEIGCGTLFFVDLPATRVEKLAS